MAHKSISHAARIRGVSASVLLPLLAACHDNGSPVQANPDPQPDNVFTAQVSGSIQRQLTGRAQFAANLDDEDHGFGLALVNNESANSVDGPVLHSVYFYRSVPGVVTPGDYDITGGSPVGNTFNVALMLDRTGANSQLCFPLSGTVHIASVSATRIAGNYTVQALCSHAGVDTSAAAVVDSTFVTVSSTGSFNAAAASIPASVIVANMPLRGRFALRTAQNQALPATVFDGRIVDSTTSFQLRATATGGSFSVNAAGRYDQRLTHDVFVDGVIAAHLRYADRGFCTRVVNQLRCESNSLQGVAFTAIIAGQTLTITQDILNEGVAASYKFSWGN